MGISAQIEDEGREGAADEGVLAEINVTPLTDVFLVLLLIFMVTSTAVSEAAPRPAAQVVVPQSNAPRLVGSKRTDPVLTVTRSNEIFLFARKVAMADLEAAIRKALQDGGTDTVLLRGDTNAMLGSAVKVMSVARKAGARTINVLGAPDSN
jgi:biopolymer transport protein ExbD